jgi:hypothetical protein
MILKPIDVAMMLQLMACYAAAFGFAVWQRIALTAS